MKFARDSSITVFTNHVATASIVIQIKLTITNTNKLNLRLIRAFQFFFILSINIRIKLEKLHLISDALFKLLNLSSKKEIEDTLKDLNDDIDFFFSKVLLRRKALMTNAENHHVDIVLNNFFEEDVSLMKMTKKFRKELLQKYVEDTT